MRQLFYETIGRRWFLTALIVINFSGTLYGFYWYRGQFAETPVYLWPFVANSPLSVLYILTVLILFRMGRRFGLLEGLAYFGLIKHGLWTVAVITQYQLAGNIYPENFFLWFGHAGMALQAVLLWYRFGLPLTVLQAAAVSAWYFFNDYLDYVVGIHPWVDPVISFVTIRNLAVGYTAVLSVIILTTAIRWRMREKTE